MREPPQVEPQSLLRALLEHYTLRTESLTFLPIGNDADSFAYRIDTAAGESYFLKLRRRSNFKVASLRLPAYLHAQGVPHILAPLPTTTGRAWATVEGFAITLYPFLEARTAREASLSETDWHSLGRALRQVHASQLPAELAETMPRESFVPSRWHILAELEATLAGPGLADPVRLELAAFWRAERERIATVLHQVATLGTRLRRLALPQVPCHADLHTWNVLVGSDEDLWIVDWDEAVLAPKERDLMFVVGGIGRDLVHPRETEAFLAGYGAEHGANPLALRYYRYAWAAQDMAAYAEEALATEFGVARRHVAMRGLMDLFAPGNIVDIACMGGARQS